MTHDAQRIAAEQLKSIVERIERLEEEKKALSDDIRDVYAEAKGNGYDTKAQFRVHPPTAEPQASFQARVAKWMLECFGPGIPMDKTERNHRFIEEALELVQSLGATRSECYQLVDYVFNRSLGEPPQEVGGAIVTLAALCCANGIDMGQAGETELARIWTKIEKIRAKQAAKPKNSPLPSAEPTDGSRK